MTGLVLAGVMAWLKNQTKLIDTGMWNIRTFSATLAALNNKKSKKKQPTQIFLKITDLSFFPTKLAKLSQFRRVFHGVFSAGQKETNKADRTGTAAK